MLAEYPQADRQHLRQLARNAREEKLRNKPPHAYRELFRELRDAHAGSGRPKRTRGKTDSLAQALGAAHGHRVDLQRRLADADRHALAVLAADADARVELQVVADHADTRFIVSGPLPISVAPFTGRVILPSSIR